MPTPFNGKFDPAGLTIVLVGITISGFQGDDFVTIAQAEPKKTTTEVGPYGDTVRSKTANKMVTVSFQLIPGCPADIALRRALKNGTEAPASITSLSDQTRLEGGVSYVEEGPELKWSKTAQPRPWIVCIPQATIDQEDLE